VALTMLSGPLVLPADVLLVPVAELSERVRRQLSWQAGDVAITRPRLRTPSRLIGAGAAELLREFASPSTVVQAVIRHSRATGADPDATLEDAYPLLSRLVREGFLVSAADAGAGSIEASWGEGERIAGCTVLSCLQVIEDTEVYQVRTGSRRSAGREAALKIERLPREAGGAGGGAGDRRRLVRSGGITARLEREAAILAYLARGTRGGLSDLPDLSDLPVLDEAAVRGGREAPVGPVAPRLLGAGSWRDQRFLLLEWCSGIDAAKAAGEARERGGEAGRAGILALCRAVAAAYASLHRQGVLHCDVHPRNVLVAAGGGVRLIDFGFASWRGSPAGLPPAGRGGVAFYFEPEYAAAVLAGQTPPAASAAGEQYAVAALLYLLAAGRHYLDFCLEREAMLRQIAGDAPRPFAERGAAAWPQLEEVLGRALAKAPEGRFASLDAFAGALQAVPGVAAARTKPARSEGEGASPSPPEGREGDRGDAGGDPVDASSSPRPSPIGTRFMARGRRQVVAARTKPARSEGAGASPSPPHRRVGTGPVAVPSLAAEMRRAGPAAELLGEMLAQVRPGGALWRNGLPSAPLASVQLGAAGIALALYRIALAREDAELLSQADLWSARAAAAERGGELAAESAFYNSSLDVTPETVGRASLFHTAPGLRCTEALIAHAQDDRGGAVRAAGGFAAAAGLPCPNPDLALGRSGLLLGCALLLDALGSSAAGEPAPSAPDPEKPAPPGPNLPALGDDLMAGLWREIDGLPPIAECQELPNLGIAHGWAGYVYSTLRWCQAAGRPVPAGVAVRLDELADMAESWGRGARWRWHGQPLAEAHRRAAPEAARWMAGWCNGSAGMVHLWSLAAQRSTSFDPGSAPTSRRRWEQLAIAAGWHAWEAGDQVESLCCGLAGRAYALLALNQQGAGEEWLVRARTLADRAALGVRRSEESAHSLYRGSLGIAVLTADLERPEGAAMPLFGREGWTGH
jgi:serine/threonine protein kinase